MVAGVIEAVMSPLMVHWERMKKTATQQVMMYVHVCVCVCVSPCTLTFSPIKLREDT